MEKERKRQMTQAGVVHGVKSLGPPGSSYCNEAAPQVHCTQTHTKDTNQVTLKRK